MIKSFWAQNDVKYRRYFEDTELFIIYGMSLSITDGWWMKRSFSVHVRHTIILYRLIRNNKSLIIFML